MIAGREREWSPAPIGGGSAGEARQASSWRAARPLRWRTVEQDARTMARLATSSGSRADPWTALSSQRCSMRVARAQPERSRAERSRRGGDDHAAASGASEIAPCQRVMAAKGAGRRKGLLDRQGSWRPGSPPSPGKDREMVSMANGPGPRGAAGE